MKNEITVVDWQAAEPEHKSGHKDYEYRKHKVVSRGDARQCVVSVYEVPPGKAAYPLHWHTQNEEVFYLLSGKGMLVTPEGEREVAAGQFLFFPACEKGAHKLVNTGSEPLTYIDFDTQNEIDVAFYPDSGKVGIWGKGINRVYRTGDAVDYYAGE